MNQIQTIESSPPVITPNTDESISSKPKFSKKKKLIFGLAALSFVLLISLAIATTQTKTRVPDQPVSNLDLLPTPQSKISISPSEETPTSTASTWKNQIENIKKENQQFLGNPPPPIDLNIHL